MISLVINVTKLSFSLGTQRRKNNFIQLRVHKSSVCRGENCSVRDNATHKYFIEKQIIFGQEIDVLRFQKTETETNRPSMLVLVLNTVLV